MFTLPRFLGRACPNVAPFVFTAVENGQGFS
jgi:hypothetical protein